jgi:hypothetical protein
LNNNTFHTSLIMILSHAPYRNYYWGINGVSLIFFYYEINNRFFKFYCRINTILVYWR